MHSFAAVLATGAVLASVVSAKPIPQVTTKKGYTVTGTIAKPRPAYPVQLANVYQKYGGSMPERVAAAAASASGSVPAIPQESDISYLSEVTIGGQTVNLDFDTGSADL